ncbi:MAG: hypothetical protein ACXAAH_06070 [Promethearchaeota archaeon]|jgi:hypothetical protein
MEKRFIMPAVFSIILTLVALSLALLPLFYGEPEMIPFIPGNGVVDTIVSIVIPFFFMFIMLLLGPIMALVLIRLHKIMKLKKYDYFIVRIEKKLSGSRILLRSIFPGLLAINIAIYISLSSSLSSFIYYDLQMIGATIEYAALLIGIPFASLLVLPLWILQALGLMCSKRVESYNRPVTPDIESVGQFYIKMLKGYVGISTVVSYTVILFQIFQTSTDITLTILMVFIDPIVIIMIFTLISLVFEMKANSLNVKVNKSLEKQNIDTTPKTIKIE